MGRDGPLATGTVDPRLARLEDKRTRSGVSRQAEREAWTVLSSIAGLGPVTFGKLLRRFGSGRAILAAARGSDGARLLASSDDGQSETEAVRISGDLVAKIVQAAIRPDDLLERVRSGGLTVVTLEDELFPRRLLAIEMPPHVLFVRGDPAVLSAASAVAVVGTRRPSEYGRRIAARIAGALARVGSTVVSGLAVGIDGASHAGAVAERSPTVAVLGGGHEHLFPHAHRRLADAIVDTGGAVVSELPPSATPTRGTFPRRNRLISGLADATVVVEAAARSGALITAGWAMEQGRPCFLVPGPIDDRTSAGCLAFLRTYPELTRIVAGVPELLQDLGLATDEAAGRPGARATPPSAAAGPARAAVLADLGLSERAVAEALMRGCATADELVVATQLPIASILGVLTMLETRGLASAAYGRYRPAGLLASS